jgi:hypothetical protein
MIAVDWVKINRIYKQKQALKNLELLMKEIKMEKIKNADITLLSEKEASRILNVSYNKLRYLRQGGLISFCRIGKSIKYRLNDLQRFVERGQVEAQA